MLDKKIIFWFRNDLRISDNPGLIEAAKNGTVVPVYILDEGSAREFKMGAASRWWLHHSLESLNLSLDNKLNIYCGDSKSILLKVIKDNNIQGVYWNRCYEPGRIKDDAIIKEKLKQMEIECKSFNGSLLWEPWTVLKKDKTPYKMYTPFYRYGCLQGPQPRKPLANPKKMLFETDTYNPKRLADLKLLSKTKWYMQMEETWETGEKAAYEKLENFLHDGLVDYKEGRNFPIKQKISRLSPHLHFGEISPHQVWWAAETKGRLTAPNNDVEHFLSEMVWREFSYYLLYHFPTLPRKNFQAKFDHFPWLNNSELLNAWQTGQTGYPIVDAGMRELWQTGYMHNRVRMIVASFLIKNLLLHWHHGENWFWDCLVDADLANNSASWQWVAGSGVDAAPYFRIFNPVTQGEKFDATGEYTRQFVPELDKLPNKFLFKPWEAPEGILKMAKVNLGKTYPKPIVDLKRSREIALAAYHFIRHSSEEDAT
jgi:deoxyribodipyrimidine photo-lyase